jgi:hypothetical protein
MTPQETRRVTELFDRLATLEQRPRDADAERLIAEGLRRAPHALYALVQTVLVQDEALRAAQARIEELEGVGPAAQQGGGFLDNMRDALFGAGERSRGSVPRVTSQGTRIGAPMGVPPGFGTGGARPDSPQAQAQTQQRGGSFLGTAAAAAAGVIGGSLLLDSLRGMAGASNRQGVSDAPTGGQSPWGSANASSNDLAKDAGVDQVGRGGDNSERSYAQHDPDADDPGAYDSADFDDDLDSDFDFGDSDFG